MPLWSVAVSEDWVLHIGYLTEASAPPRGHEQWCAQRCILGVDVGSTLYKQLDARIAFIFGGHVTRQVQRRLVFSSNRAD